MYIPKGKISIGRPTRRWGDKLDDYWMGIPFGRELCKIDRCGSSMLKPSPKNWSINTSIHCNVIFVRV